MLGSTVKFLLVDDLEGNLLALEGLLRREGLELHKARSGTEALELLLAHDFALALIDVQMPEMNGFELAELMRGTARTRRVPIIFITAGAVDTQRRFRGYEAGAVDFLTKPIEPHILKSKAEVFFELYRQRQEVARQRDELSAVARENARLLGESRRIAEALRESESRFRNMADGAPVLLWVHDAEAKLQFVNRAYCDFFGVTIERVIGDAWKPLLHPDDAENYCVAFQRAHEQQATFHAQARVRRADGSWRWIQSHGSPRFARDGEYLGVAGSSVDITERKDFEAELQRQVAERTAKLKEANEQLNAFCYSIAHDLKAPLRAQAAYASLLQEDFAAGLGPEGCGYAKRISEAAQRQSQLVSDLLSHMSISRADFPLQPVSLGAMVDQATTDLAMEIEQTQAKLETSSLEGFVLANAASLHLVVSNLLSNALKFVKKGSRPEIRIWSEPITHALDGSRQSPREGYIRLSVQDRGIGIAPEYHNKLFGVFQRLHTSEHYPGTGIGLAIVRKAIERMGGRVGLESTVGQGTRFWVDLKRAEPPAQKV